MRVTQRAVVVATVLVALLGPTAATSFAAGGPMPTGCSAAGGVSVGLVQYPNGPEVVGTVPAITCKAGSGWTIRSYAKVRTKVTGTWVAPGSAMVEGLEHTPVHGEGTLCNVGEYAIPGSKWQGVAQIVFVKKGHPETKVTWFAYSPNLVACP
jgi:hypothetical protein